MSNIRPISDTQGYRPALREVMRKDATYSRGPDDEMNERIAAYIRRVWPEHTAAKLAGALGRKESTAGARAVIECRRALTLSDFKKLFEHPRFGMPFVRDAFGLPPDPERDELIRQVEYLKHCIRKI